MVVRMSATEASRSFSSVLSRVAAGETVEIERHGVVVAALTPVRRRAVPGSDLAAALRSLPPVDDEFGTDIAALSGVLRAAPDPWQS